MPGRYYSGVTWIACLVSSRICNIPRWLFTKGSFERLKIKKLVMDEVVKSIRL